MNLVRPVLFFVAIQYALNIIPFAKHMASKSYIETPKSSSKLRKNDQLTPAKRVLPSLTRGVSKNKLTREQPKESCIFGSDHSGERISKWDHLYITDMSNLFS